jgi:hypothetical protein
VWLAGLAVALGAGVATAHGLYEVALAAGTPRVLAWLYPLITDGLALVAYAATARLADHGRRYAWTVVVAAAGLSGLTQASYLAGGVASAPPALRFAIGAWPAIAAAIVAHLLFLLGTHHQPTTRPEDTTDTPQPLTAAPAQPTPQALLGPKTAATQAPPAPTACGPQHLLTDRATPPPLPTAVHPSPRLLGQPLNTPLDSQSPSDHRSEHPPGSSGSPVARASAAPAGDRALTVAREHAARHGQLPTVSALATLARVARGTAATALKELRNQPTQPHSTETTNQARTTQ